MTTPDTLKLPDHAPTLRAIAHLTDSPALSGTVILGFDGGRRVARVISPRLSDGQAALWTICGWLANAPGDLFHPHLDDVSQAAVREAMRLALGGVEAAA